MSYHTEQTEIGTDIVIDGWEKGITDNPYEGIYDSRNCDAVTIPGEVSVAMATQAMNSQGTITNVLFAVNTGPNEIQYNGTVPIQVGTAVMFTNAGGLLPAPLVANTPYYVKQITSSLTFTISLTVGGTAIDITTGGSGTNTFSTINMDTIKFFTDTVIPSNAGTRIYFALDASGRVWISYNINQPAQPITWIYMNNLANESSTKPASGLIAWSNYLFVFTDTSIYTIPLYIGSFTYGSITTKTNWINWQITTSNTYSTISHYAKVSINDNSIYFCNGNYVGFIGYNANASTNPNATVFNTSTGRVVTDGVINSTTTITSATMNFTQADVGAFIYGTGIPAGAYIASVTNSTTAILSAAATATSGSITFTIYTTYSYNANVLPLPNNDQANCLEELGNNLMVGGVNNYIYPWDRVSTNFNTPIFLSETVITRMVTINTTMYIFCGFKGRIFITNGANATPFYKVPDYLSGTTNPYIIWNDAAFNRNQLYFGFQVTSNDGTAINNYGGLWAVDVDSVSPVSPRLQNQLSYGTYAGYASAIHIYREFGYNTIPSSDGYGMFIGWYDGVSTNNIDKGISTPYTAGQAYTDCDPIAIGQYLNKKTITGIEYKLAQPLATNETVAIGYRTQLSGGYTDNPMTQLSDVSGWGSPVFQTTQWLQIRLTLTSTITNPSYCRVREVRIHLQ